MASKVLGLGTTLSVDVTGSTSFASVDNVITVTPPGRDREKVESTALADTLESTKEGIEKEAKMEFTMFLDPDDTVHTGVYTLFGSKVSANWKITMTDATPSTRTFLGTVTNIEDETIEKAKCVIRKVTVTPKAVPTIA